MVVGHAQAQLQGGEEPVVEVDAAAEVVAAVALACQAQDGVEEVEADGDAVEQRHLGGPTYLDGVLLDPDGHWLFKRPAVLVIIVKGGFGCEVVTVLDGRDGALWRGHAPHGVHRVSCCGNAYRILQRRAPVRPRRRRGGIHGHDGHQSDNHQQSLHHCATSSLRYISMLGRLALVMSMPGTATESMRWRVCPMLSMW